MGGYRGQFEPWRPFYLVIPTNEYSLTTRANTGAVLAAAIIVNRFINRMTGKLQ